MNKENRIPNKEEDIEWFVRGENGCKQRTTREKSDIFAILKQTRH